MPVALFLGLGAAVFWGSADFLGGLQSRKLPALSVVLWSEVVGGAATGVTLLAVDPRPQLAGVAWGVAAGAAVGLSLVLFYRALAVGTMSIVASVSACGALLPVAVAYVRGDSPGPVATVGIVSAILGIVLVSRSTGRDEARIGWTAQRRSIAMALVSAVGFGLFFVLINEGFAAEGSSALWVLGGARVGAFAALAPLILGSRLVAPWPGPRWRFVVAIGLLEYAASFFNAFALIHGNLGVVAVLGAQYSVVTVLLARLVLAERLAGIQSLGVLLALLGVGLLATA